MANKKESGLIIGGTVLGLLMGGPVAHAAVTTTEPQHEFFKFQEIKGSFQLAAADEDNGEKKCSDDKKCGEDKNCGENSCG